MRMFHRALIVGAVLSTAPFLLVAEESAPSFSPDEPLTSEGFDIDLRRLDELLRFETSVRTEESGKISAEWGDRFESLLIVDLPSVRNRYAYAVDRRDGCQLVAIRGTANVENAILDVEFRKDLSPYLGIELHRGFEKAALAVFRDLEPRLGKDLPVFVAGHSLGAAEAIILGMLLKRSGHEVASIVASGPPKVTDATGWEHFKDLSVIRIVDPFDPVPFLPFRSLYSKAPYEQGGPLLMLLDGPYLTIVPPGYYDDLPDALKGASSVGDHFDVPDHRVWTYADRAGEKLDSASFVPFSDWERYAVPRDDGKTPSK